MLSEAFETKDLHGRRVVLDARTVDHLARRRPGMLRHARAVLATVSRPDRHEDDLVSGRERFFRRDLDPGRWLRVVVDFNESPGFVVTAFVQNHAPESGS